MMLDRQAWRFCVAPMLEITDAACRYVHRLLSVKARLYTEMVTAPALMHGDAGKLLRHDACEHPVALQIAGSDPRELALCAVMGEKAGFDEINLNCGCPSERVQQGRFGAALMKEPALVAECVRRMADAVSVPVTVKHRIGVDDLDSESFTFDFVGTLYEAGVRVFIVHARKAWLKGLSPEQNRTVPPLESERVFRVKRAFPEAVVVFNGAIATVERCEELLERGVDGVMLGRAVDKNPWLLREVDRRLFGLERAISRRQVVEAVAARARATWEGDPRAVKAYARVLMGLAAGLPGARDWRRFLSETKHFETYGPEVFTRALQYAPTGF